jgi:putative hydrolase of the HAD superfamily
MARQATAGRAVAWRAWRRDTVAGSTDRPRRRAQGSRSRRHGHRGATWIFDLDNTLHDAAPHILPHINRAMTDYVARHLAVDEARANELRTRYWHRYGATLLGLVRHHGVDPHHFLWHTHQFTELRRMVLRHPALRSMLRRLPGRKIVFSNAPEHYARAVLRILAVAQHFDGIFTIERTRFRPKPDIGGFRRLLRAYRLHPARCIMVEDSDDNLRTAKRLGMRTVLVGPAGRRPHWVDVSVRDVAELPRALSGASVR